MLDACPDDIIGRGARRFGLLGFAWYKEAELFGGTYATLADYAAVIYGG